MFVHSLAWSHCDTRSTYISLDIPRPELSRVPRFVHGRASLLRLKIKLVSRQSKINAGAHTQTRVTYVARCARLACHLAGQRIGGGEGEKWGGRSFPLNQRCSRERRPRATGRDKSAYDRARSQTIGTSERALPPPPPPPPPFHAASPDRSRSRQTVLDLFLSSSVPECSIVVHYSREWVCEHTAGVMSSGGFRSGKCMYIQSVCVHCRS